MRGKQASGCRKRSSHLNNSTLERRPPWALVRTLHVAYAKVARRSVALQRLRMRTFEVSTMNLSRLRHLTVGTNPHSGHASSLTPRVLAKEDVSDGFVGMFWGRP